jgi:hypothetical protein
MAASAAGLAMTKMNPTDDLPQGQLILCQTVDATFEATAKQVKKPAPPRGKKGRGKS